MKVCIIGGVAGGASAAARLRRLDESAKIVLFERDEYISFANCGLPYHISGKIAERSSLILQTPESLGRRFNLDVRVFNEVISIDKERKELRVRKIKEEIEYTEKYDKLILSPGAAPFVPPIDGSDADFFMTLRNIPDLDRIMSYISRNKVASATIIGGGFIGIEVAENLKERGINTHVVELANQVMAPFDLDMANIVQDELRRNGIHLYLEDAVKKIVHKKIELSKGAIIESDLVICAIGVRPETKLAKSAGLEIGKTGGIKVDSTMRSSDPHIYAIGDAIEVEHYITDDPILIPLAGPANKQGRIAADNIAGISSHYRKTLGTGILKVFDLIVASTGINEKQAIRSNLNYQAIHIHPANHAGYYPGSVRTTLKLIFDKDSGKILGAQGVGKDGIDKRIDVLATAIRGSMTVYDLEHLELGYAPPFGSAKDPVNMAGFVAVNIMQGLVNSITYDKIAQLGDVCFLDVRTQNEHKDGSIPNAIWIPIDELRNRIEELPRDRNIILFCAVGVRAYIAYRILKQANFEKIYNLSGGYTTYLNYSTICGK